MYIKGEKNVAADALSRLPTTEKELDDTNIEPRLEELMMQRRVYEGEANFPLAYDQISDSQAGDRTLRDWTQNGHPTKVFRQEQFGGHEIWTYRARNKKRRQISNLHSRRKERGNHRMVSRDVTASGS